jgi:hypothetical protein
MMKKIRRVKYLNLSPVKMYWDDLLEIHERIIIDRDVTISSGEYEYENINELKENHAKDFIEKVEISGRGKKYSNNINVDIKPEKVTISHDSASIETAAIVKELISNNSPWYMYNPDSIIWKTTSMSLGFLSPLLVTILLKPIANISLKLLLIVIGFAIMAWSFKEEPILGRTKIYSSIRKDKLTFWERNKEQILQQLLIGIILLVIGYVVGHFTK